jgi:hypothetical protein
MRKTNVCRFGGLAIASCLTALTALTACGDSAGDGAAGGSVTPPTADARPSAGGEETDAASPVADARSDQGAPRDTGPPTDSGAGGGGGADGALPDAAPPVRADEPPTEGEANLPGAGELTAAVAAGSARAGRVDVDAERLRGPEANCRVGDFRLDNALISVCIQDEDNYGIFSFSGGTLIDAHRADRPGTDLLQEIIVSPEVGAASAERVGIVRDGAGGGAAIVRVEGRALPSRLIQGLLPGRFVPPDLRLVTEYRLAPDTDTVDILTWIEGDRVAGRALLADVVLFGDRTRGFNPGTTREGVAANPTPFLAADGPEVSYAFESTGPLSFLSIPTSETPVTAITYGSALLRVGDQRLLRRRLRVGTGDVESVRTPPADAVSVTLTGLPGAGLAVADRDGRAVTRAVLDAEGRRTVSLSPGDHLVSTTPGFVGVPLHELPMAVAAGAPAEFAVPLTAGGVLHVTAQDTLGAPLAVRLNLTSAAGEELVRWAVEDAALPLPPGDWHVVATRGWHFEIAEADVTVTSGETTPLPVVLEETLPFEGWTSGEFHQHASPSADSDVDPRDRVLSNVTAGVGFMAPSEHDIVWDFAGLVSAMGLSERIMVFQGTEISPLYAHLGAYPMPYQPDQSGGGGVVLPLQDMGTWRWRHAPELVAEARRLGAEILQINHPRSSPSGYLQTIGYAPGEPLDTLSPEDFTRDFDSIEVFNESDQFCEVMTDWMSLLNQGMRLTAVGNSDTHSVGQPPGYPRNYLQTLAPRPEGVQSPEIVDALRDGAIFVGGGAVMDFPDGPHPGATVTPVDGTFSLRVRVRTPRWAGIDHLYAFVNGALAWETPVAAGVEAIVDFDDVVRLPVAEDAHVVFVAIGPRLRFLRGGQPTFAVANPVWVDVDGGGITPLGNVAAVFPHLEFCD